jgi:glycogen debranching enzyme
MFSRSGRLGKYSYFLGNGRCFFYRFSDSGFRNKWCGLWCGGKKISEYFAVKANGEWLSPENQKSFEYDFSKAVHTYETDAGRVTETLFVPEDSSSVMVVIDAPPKTRIEVKVAANVRLANENVTDRRYTLSEAKDRVEMENGLGKAVISIGEGGRFEFSGTYEEHTPSGERQNYFMPGKISFTRIRSVFSVGAELSDVRNADALLRMKKSHHASLLRGMIASDCRELSKAFESCILSLELLKKDGGYYAGLPWFQQFWGRDILWSLPAIISLGRHFEARDILSFFAEKSEKGRIPNFVSESGERALNAIDATPLWVIGLERYVRCSGDVEFLRSMEKHLQSSMEFLSSRSAGGFLMHDSTESETWMDTLKRKGAAVEVQALYFRALLSASYLFQLLGKDSGTLQKSAEFLSKNFDDVFLRDGFYADRIENGKAVTTMTANAFVPLFMGPGKGCPGMLECARSPRFLSARGIRTRARDDPGYDPKGYHTGSAWSLTTAWAAAAEFSCGRPQQGWDIMKILAEDTERDALGCIGECWNPEDMSLSGCPLQLWGAALFITLVDDFMLGIEANAPGMSVSVCPRIPSHIKKIERTILIGREQVTITFEKTEKGLSVSCSSPAVNLIKKPAQINYVNE